MTDTSTVEPAVMEPAVKGRGLIQSFGERRVLDGVDLALRGGEVLALAVGVLRSHALDRRIWQLEGVCLQAVWQAINSTNTAENADAPENGDGDLLVLWRQVSPH